MVGSLKEGVAKNSMYCINKNAFFQRKNKLEKPKNQRGEVFIGFLKLWLAWTLPLLDIFRQAKLCG